MHVCAPDLLHVCCELSNCCSCLAARWHVQTNGRGAARICSWRWCPTLLEQVGPEFLAALLPTCSRPRAHTAPGPGRAHGSPGTARDTEHAARPRNVRFVDTVDSYKIRTRRAPQHRPPPRPARRIVYDQPSVTRISTLPTTARGTPHYHGTRNPAPTRSCRCPPALPSMPAWMAPPHLPTAAQTCPRNLELLLPTSVQGPVQVRSPPGLNG